MENLGRVRLRDPVLGKKRQDIVDDTRAQRRLVVHAMSRGFEMYSPKTKCHICGASRDYLKVTKDGLKCLVCGYKWKKKK